MLPDARLMCGISLILVPTIVNGRLTVLNVISNGVFGTPGPKNLSPSQGAYYRAGHAHAGVLTLLALFVQIAADYASIPQMLVWPVRIGAVAAALLVSGDSLPWPMYEPCVVCSISAFSLSPARR